MPGFGLDLRRRRRQARNKRRRVVNEPLDADEIGVILGERAIKLFRILDSGTGRAPRGRYQRSIRRRAFPWRCARAFSAGPRANRRFLPEAGKSFAVALEIDARGSAALRANRQRCRWESPASTNGLWGPHVRRRGGSLHHSTVFLLGPFPGVTLLCASAVEPS